MRNAGVWAYGIVNLTHILGVSSLFGAVLVLDLRLLGFWRSIPLASIARPTVPISSNSSSPLPAHPWCAATGSAAIASAAATISGMNRTCMATSFYP